MPLPRNLARWLIKRLSDFLTKTKIPDVNSGLRIMDKDIVARYMYLLPDGFSFTTTITIAMLTDNYYVHYEPIGYSPRVGRSKINPMFDFSRFVYLILTTILCFKPVRVFIPLSLISFGASLLVLVSSWLFLEKVMDITTILLFLSGANFFSTGLIAELIVRLSKRDR